MPAAPLNLLDVFSCAGLGADGYRRAGWRVTCVDTDRAALAHAAKSGHATIHADALEVLADEAFMAQFAVVHASPPCQGESSLRNLADAQGKGQGRAVNLLQPVRDLLDAWGGPFIIENVERSKWMRAQPGVVRLCGSSWGLKVQRHRLFAPGGGVALMAPPCNHAAFDRDPITRKPRPWGVYYSKGDRIPGGGRTVDTLEDGHAVMGVTERVVPWKYLCEGLPPVFTEHLGYMLRAAVPAAVT